MDGGSCALGFLFLYSPTDLIGPPPATAGNVVLIEKIRAGVNNPLIGVLADRTRSKEALIKGPFRA